MEEPLFTPSRGGSEYGTPIIEELKDDDELKFEEEQATQEEEEEDKEDGTDTLPDFLVPMAQFCRGLGLSDDERNEMVAAGFDTLDTLWELEQDTLAMINNIRLISQQRLLHFIDYRDAELDEDAGEEQLNVTHQALRRWRREQSKKEAANQSVAPGVTTRTPSVDPVTEAMRRRESEAQINTQKQMTRTLEDLADKLLFKRKPFAETFKNIVGAEGLNLSLVPVLLINPPTLTYHPPLNK